MNKPVHIDRAIFYLFSPFKNYGLKSGLQKLESSKHPGRTESDYDRSVLSRYRFTGWFYFFDVEREVVLIIELVMSPDDYRYIIIELFRIAHPQRLIENFFECQVVYVDMESMRSSSKISSHSVIFDRYL